ELARIGLARRESIVDGCVIRMPKAYPIYDETYAEAVAILRSYLSRFDNLHLVGRNGMHKYNNQDHSMLTAMLAVENIYGAQHDLWSVNVDEAYHEEIAATNREDVVAGEIRDIAGTQPSVPLRIGPEPGLVSARVQAPAHAPADL
ncbi:MAG: hypothetical protein ACRD15_19850, partial [Vicinamibacterales bacterium]